MRLSGLIGILAVIAAICLWETQAMAANGLITIKSSFGPQDTMTRLETEVKAKGLTVFALSLIHI